MADNVRVLVAVEIRLYREGLANLLAHEAGFAVVGTAEDHIQVVEHSRRLRPNVVLLDCGLARSLSLVRELSEVSPGLRVVALGIEDCDAEVMSYAQAGISGYVTRDGTRDQLIAAIRSAACGQFICTPRVAAMLLHRVTAIASVERRFPDVLTRREQQVMELMTQDLSNKAIATRLHIEVSTVKNHVHHVLEKLQLTHRRQVAIRMLAPAQGGSRSQDPLSALEN